MSRLDDYYYHGIFLTVAWFGLLFINIGSVRWFSAIWNKTIYIHAITGQIITALTIFWTLKLGLDFSPKEPHKFIGTMYFMIIIPVAITGMISMIARKKLAWNTKFVWIIRRIHKFLASTLVIASFLQISSGLLIYHNKISAFREIDNWSFIYLPVAIILFSACEVYFRIKRDAAKYEINVLKKFEGDFMTEIEFEEKIKAGEQLVILDDLVLDMTKYAEMHPGGSFLISHNVGRDVSKFFHGGHALDNNSNDPKAQTPKHAHSNIARLHARDLAVAVYSKKNCTPTYIGYIDQANSTKLSEHTSTFAFNLFKQKDQNIGGDYLPVKPYYKDFECFGKHYLVGAASSGQGEDVQTSYTGQIVRRHYTIANCMEKTFYDKLMKAGSEFLNGNSPSSALTYDYIESLAKKEGGKVDMTIKDYKVPGGLSFQFQTAALQQQAYEIKGPMGKGFGLNQNSSGFHLIFACGTGILPFIDLISRLLLSTLEIIPESERCHKDFKLHVYVSYAARDESVALELLELLDQCQKKKGLDQFRLILRLSKGGTGPKPPRWDRKYLESELANCKKNQKINKVMVCGPPLIDEQFDKILVEIAQNYDIDFRTQVDIL